MKKILISSVLAFAFISYIGAAKESFVASKVLACKCQEKPAKDEDKLACKCKHKQSEIVKSSINTMERV